MVEPRTLTESLQSPPEGMPEATLAANEWTSTQTTHKTMGQTHFSAVLASASARGSYISIFILKPNDTANSRKPQYGLHDV